MALQVVARQERSSPRETYDCWVGTAGAETSSENLLRSIFPPLTTHTILPLPALPLSPAATAHAAAPSQIKWFRAATIFIARRVSSSETTIDPASRRLAKVHMLGKTDLPPQPSTKLVFQSGNFCAEPFRNDR